MTEPADTNSEIRVEPLTIGFTVYFGLQQPEQAGDRPPVLLLALHGWGQSCRSFMRRFAALRNRNIIVVTPQAPHQFYLDAQTKKVGFNWLTIYDRQQSILDVNGYLLRLIEHLDNQPAIYFDRVVLLGFSQGSSMAYRFAISGLYPIAGLISCCSDLPADVVQGLSEAKRFPVLLAHGSEDTLVPEQQITDAMESLTAAKFPYEGFRFRGGHEITPELVEKVGDWIEERGVQKAVGTC